MASWKEVKNNPVKTESEESSAKIIGGGILLVVVISLLIFTGFLLPG